MNHEAFLQVSGVRCTRPTTLWPDYTMLLLRIVITFGSPITQFTLFSNQSKPNTCVVHETPLSALRVYTSTGVLNLQHMQIYIRPDVDWFEVIDLLAMIRSVFYSSMRHLNFDILRVAWSRSTNLLSQLSRVKLFGATWPVSCACCCLLACFWHTKLAANGCQARNQRVLIICSIVYDLTVADSFLPCVPFSAYCISLLWCACWSCCRAFWLLARWQLYRKNTRPRIQCRHMHASCCLSPRSTAFWILHKLLKTLIGRYMTSSMY
jgi:hypothetical protein